MKKGSTVAAKEDRKISEQKLTVGLDLGDRSSWYCVLDESGVVVLEQRMSTTPKAIEEMFGGMPRSRIALGHLLFLRVEDRSTNSWQHRL